MHTEKSTSKNCFSPSKKNWIQPATPPHSPPLTLPFPGTDAPLTPDSTVGELMAYIHPR